MRARAMKQHRPMFPTVISALAAGFVLAMASAEAQSPAAPEAAPPAAATKEADPGAKEAAKEGTFIVDDQDISGEEEYIRYCAVCHGMTGKGDGPLAKSLKKKPADLTRIAERNDGYFPFSQVARIIRDGGEIDLHGTADMPVWGEVFRDHVDAIMARALIFELTLYLEDIQVAEKEPPTKNSK
jgi:mono/diheme cytochrome c family protein